jgi:MYXO-CTERM domain-containing protein
MRRSRSRQPLGPDVLRTGRRARISSVLLALYLLLPQAAAAGSHADPGQASEATRAGEFCPIGGCRSAPASPWSGAAFGAALVATLWTARRREHTGP